MPSQDENFGALKVSPFFHASDEAMEAYLAEHDLPNEWDYFDPAKADATRACNALLIATPAFAPSDAATIAN